MTVGSPVNVEAGLVQRYDGPGASTMVGVPDRCCRPGPGSERFLPAGTLARV